MGLPGVDNTLGEKRNVKSITTLLTWACDRSTRNYSRLDDDIALQGHGYFIFRDEILTRDETSNLN